ncbi:MAG: hypothetical protein ACK5PP_14045, partial [Acidimicrobiales bacterium]
MTGEVPTIRPGVPGADPVATDPARSGGITDRIAGMEWQKWAGPVVAVLVVAVGIMVLTRSGRQSPPVAADS